MVRSLDQINRDQDRLEKATVKIDAQLSETYQQYLSVLGDAVQQQLVLATYHLCTQSYPEAFLKLSIGQRETLQKRVRQLGQKGKMHIEALERLDNVAATLNLLLQPHAPLGSLLETAEHPQLHHSQPKQAIEAQSEDASEVPSEEKSEANHADAAATHALLMPAHISQPFDSKALVPVTADQALKADPEESASAANVALKRDEALDQDSPKVPPAPPREKPAASNHGPSPLNLAKRHVLLERQIRAVLHALSSMTNHTLQQAKILPDLPEAVLNAATEAEADEPSPKVPNLLNVMIEIDQDGDAKAEEETPADTELEMDLEATERSMTHLVAINLRLADIEFTDTRTALWRSKIQEILGQLKKLSRHYQKLQQEGARAEAEAAWRATWFEEKPNEPS